MHSAFSRAARLVCLLAGVAAAALPAAGRGQTTASHASRDEAPAVHAPLPSLAPVIERAAVQVASQRRSPVPAAVALAASASESLNSSNEIARERPNAYDLAAARVAARGYDATAPPRT